MFSFENVSLNCKPDKKIKKVYQPDSVELPLVNGNEISRCERGFCVLMRLGRASKERHMRDLARCFKDKIYMRLILKAARPRASINLVCKLYRLLFVSTPSNSRSCILLLLNVPLDTYRSHSKSGSRIGSPSEDVESFLWDVSTFKLFPCRLQYW